MVSAMENGVVPIPINSPMTITNFHQNIRNLENEVGVKNSYKKSMTSGSIFSGTNDLRIHGKHTPSLLNTKMEFNVQIKLKNGERVSSSRVLS